MSALRILGLVLSIIVLLTAIIRYRRSNLSRQEGLWIVGISLALMSVSISPSLLNVPARLIFGTETQIPRLLLITVVGLGGAYLSLVYVFARLGNTRALIYALSDELINRDFLGRHPGFDLNNKIVIVIPALNEADNIVKVLPRIPSKLFGYEVTTLVVDDASSDSTFEKASSLGAYVVKNLLHRGGGAGLRIGYKLAVRGKAAIVVSMDSDGQHKPEEIERLVRPIVDNEAEVVGGSRTLGYHEPANFVRTLGLRIFNGINSVLIWKRITDCASGFRAMRADVLSKLDLREDQFHTAELIIQTHRSGLRFVEVPITGLRRASGASKKPTHFLYGLGFAKSILKAWMR